MIDFDAISKVRSKSVVAQRSHGSSQVNTTLKGIICTIFLFWSMGRAPGVCAEIQPNFPAATPTMQPLPNISVLLPSKTHSRSLSPIEEPESQEMSFEEAGYTPVIAVPYSPGDFEYLISSLKGFSEPFEPLSGDG